MEIKVNKSAKKRKIKLPPQRGMIRIKIFKKIGKGFMWIMMGCFGLNKDSYGKGSVGKPVAVVPIELETTGG